jgi:acid phosphatase
VDLLDQAGLNYHVYSENYPTSGQCYLGSGYGDETASDVANFNPGTNNGTSPVNRLYRRKHNPFISFQTFVNNSTRCATQKDFDNLNQDLASGNLPAFSFVVPNQAHDGHDTTIAYSGIWFAQFIQNVTTSPVYQQSRVLIHVTYDEDDTAYTYNDNAPFDNAGNPNPYYNATCAALLRGPNGSSYPSQYCVPDACKNLLNCTLDVNNNKVYSILLGSALSNNLIGTSDNNFYNHYSVLATLEANWGLDNLGRFDVGASIFALDPPSAATKTSNGSMKIGQSLPSWPLFVIILVSLGMLF